MEPLWTQQLMLCRTLQKPMETVSCSVLHPLPFFNTCSYNKHFQFLKTQLSFLPTFSTNSHFPRKNFPHFNGLTAFRSLPPHNNPNPSQELAILLEVEGWGPFSWFRILVFYFFFVSVLVQNSCIFFSFLFFNGSLLLPYF